RVHDVASGFGHLLAILAKNDPLVDEFEKRLRCGDMAQVIKHLVPEPSVKQMQHSVLGATDVQINTRSYRLQVESCRLSCGGVQLATFNRQLGTARAPPVAFSLLADE